MVRVVVERYFEVPVDLAEVERWEQAEDWCFDTNGVRRVESYLSQDRTRMICVFEAPDAEAVRRANQASKIPFRAVWIADLFEV